MKKTNKPQKKIWFRAKCYGWGWYPSSWHGWLVLFIWFVLFVLSMALMKDELVKNLIVIFIITGILLGICWKKGEKPRWRWGNK
jgi:hypothetical protein